VGLYTGFLPGAYFVYYARKVFRLPPQIWRVATCFLITRPKLGILFDTYWVYNYTSQIEHSNPKFRTKEDVVWYLMFVAGVLHVINFAVFGSSYGVLTPGLIMALCYSATQDLRGQKTTLYFFTIPAQTMPYALLLLSLILDGPYYFMLELAGLLAAHLHDFLSRLYPEFGGGPNLISTPGFLSRLVQTPRIFRRDYGTAIRPPQAGASARGTGNDASSGGVLPESWRTRGPGRRLGGD